jgi:hypothetical protein
MYAYAARVQGTLPSMGTFLTAALIALSLVIFDASTPVVVPWAYLGATGLPALALGFGIGFITGRLSGSRKATCT